MPVEVKTRAEYTVELLPKLDDSPAVPGDWGGVPVRPVAFLEVTIKIDLPGPNMRTRDLDRLFAYPDLNRQQAAEKLVAEFERNVRAQFEELQRQLASAAQRLVNENFPNAPLTSNR
jgi:hypothetical protein